MLAREPGAERLRGRQAQPGAPAHSCRPAHWPCPMTQSGEGRAAPIAEALHERCRNKVLDPRQASVYVGAQIRRLKVGVVELMGSRPAPGPWNRVMKPNFASIMPQVIVVWCEQMDHDVTFVCHIGDGDLRRQLPSDLDVLFISAFTDVTNCGAPEGDFFGAERALEVMRSSLGARSADTGEELCRAVRAFERGGTRRDDVTAVVVRCLFQA